VTGGCALSRKKSEARFIAASVVRPVSRAKAEALGLRDADFHPDTSMVVGVNTHETWVSIPLTAEWCAFYRLVPQNGQPIVAEVRVFPLEKIKSVLPGEWSAQVLGGRATVPDGGITATLLRKLRVGSDFLCDREALKQFHEHTRGELHDFIFDKRGFDVPSDENQKSRAGRKPFPDIFYARIARHYAQAWESRSAKPIVHIARRLRMSEKKVRSLVHEARQRKLLTPAMHGRPGGQLTPKAHVILGRNEPPHRSSK
jgi:hypothetical protein